MDFLPPSSTLCVLPVVNQFVFCLTLFGSICVTTSSFLFILISLSPVSSASLSLWLCFTAEQKMVLKGQICVNIPSIIQATARLCVYTSSLCNIHTERHISTKRLRWLRGCLGHDMRGIFPHVGWVYLQKISLSHTDKLLSSLSHTHYMLTVIIHSSKYFKKSEITDAVSKDCSNKLSTICIYYHWSYCFQAQEWNLKPKCLF